MCVGEAALMGAAMGVQALAGTVSSIASESAAYEQQSRAADVATQQYYADARSRDLQAQSVYQQAEEEAAAANRQSAADKGEIAKEADKRASQQRAAASYAGLSEGTLSRLLGEIRTDEAENISTVENNRQNQMIQATNKKQNAYESAYTPPANIIQPVSPNYAGSLLGGLVGGGLSSFGSYKTTQRQINMYSKRG